MYIYLATFLPCPHIIMLGGQDGKHQTASSYLSWLFMHIRKCVSASENQEIFLVTWDNEFTFRRQVAKYLYHSRVWLILCHCENVLQCLSWYEEHLSSRIDFVARKFRNWIIVEPSYKEAWESWHSHYIIQDSFWVYTEGIHTSRTGLTSHSFMYSYNEWINRNE